MRKGQPKYHGSPVPIRLDDKQLMLLGEFQGKTGLSKSFIIRRCVGYALERFANSEIDILTLREK